MRLLPIPRVNADESAERGARKRRNTTAETGNFFTRRV